MKATIVALAVVAVGGIVTAQTSTSYRLEDHVFNAGGDPSAGTFPTSSGYAVTLDAIGEGVVGSGPSSASYRIEGGFACAFTPPGEVRNLAFLDDRTLVWEAERSGGAYNLYRDLLSAMTGLDYGECEQPDLADETATDDQAVPISDGYFYLVTAENRLGEEGTLGADSSGAERRNLHACP